ncbi:MAG TPA: recombinase family protein, partial [Fimbriimonadaceae bacterium]|nr:recombinase family protein [Fimbriimonadaceae bacterium]
LKAFGDKHGMVHVDNIILDGVSGSLPGARTDIEEIIELKRLKDNFDVLLVQDLSRLTRGGPEHGGKVEYDLAAAGIELVLATGDLPTGDHGSILRCVSYVADKHAAKGISFATTRGHMSAIMDGRTAHCGSPPYGVDRLYVDRDGRELHVIRLLPDGRQQKLHPTSGELLAEFDASSREKFRHYVKQAGESVTLVPGAPEQVEVVRRIFQRHLVDHWGCYRIATELNALGAKSQRGRNWTIGSVHKVLHNPVYLGRGLANYEATGVHHLRDRNGPRPTNRGLMELASRPRPRRTVRPPTDWVWMEYPRLEEFLDPETRELARLFQQRQQDFQLTDRPKRRTRDRHRDSPFLLKGMLRSVQGDFELTGRVTGSSKTDRTRYYWISRKYGRYTRSSGLGRMIPAEPLEHAVLNAVRDALTVTRHTEEEIRRVVAEQVAAARTDNAELPGLEAQRNDIIRQMEFIMNELGSAGKEAMKRRFQQLEAKLEEIESRMSNVKRLSKGSVLDPEAEVQIAVAAIRNLHAFWADAPRPALRQLLQSVVKVLRVDLVTRQVQLEMALPMWAVSELAGKPAGMCPVSRQSKRSRHQAHGDFVLISAIFDCDWSRQQRCFTCHRSARRAA